MEVSVNEKQKELAPRGRGKCKQCSKCDAYNSDSTNSGRCICGHTAAEHE
jgi:hypothetical protein